VVEYVDDDAPKVRLLLLTRSSPWSLSQLIQKSPEREFLLPDYVSAADDLSYRKGDNALSPKEVTKELSSALSKILKSNLASGASFYRINRLSANLTLSLERINIDTGAHATHFLQLHGVSRQPGHAYTFRTGLGNKTRRRPTREELKYEPVFPNVPLIDASPIRALSFSDANIVSP